MRMFSLHCTNILSITFVSRWGVLLDFEESGPRVWRLHRSYLCLRQCSGCSHVCGGLRWNRGGTSRRKSLCFKTCSGSCCWCNSTTSTKLSSVLQASWAKRQNSPSMHSSISYTYYPIPANSGWEDRLPVNHRADTDNSSHSHLQYRQSEA